MASERFLVRLGVVAGSVGVLHQLGLMPSPAQAAAPPPLPAAAHSPDTRFLALHPNAKLVMVDVVFRHGARTTLTKKPELWRRTGAVWDVCGPAYKAVQLSLMSTTGGPAPENAHNLKQVNTLYEGGCHMGQLTFAGQLQARELGDWLRQRYINQLKLLPETYQEGLIATRTTHYQRTIGTLAGVLTGLLGSAAPNEPIPTVTSSDVDEILYADTRTCPHLAVFMKMGKQLAGDLVKRDPEYQWACEELIRLGWLDASILEKPKQWVFADLHDVVTALAAAGKPIPQGFTPRLVRAINRLATKEFAPLVAPSITDTYGHAMLRLAMGVLLHTLVENMEKAASNSTNTTPGNTAVTTTQLPRMHLYSGHDSTVMPLLSALGQDVLDSWPPFLSNLIFELWQLPEDQGGQHVVRVLFNREELDIPHCPSGKYATLEAFKNEVLLPFLLSQEDFHEQCKVPVRHDSSLPSVQQASGSGPGSDEQDE